MQPIIIEDSISIAANSVNSNVIASNTSLRRYLRAPFRAQGTIMAGQPTTGLRLDFDYGSKNVVADSEPRVVGGIEYPQDVLNDDWYCNEGDQLVLRANNPTAGALTLRYRIVLTPWEGDFPPDSRTMQRGPVAVATGSVDQQLLDGLRYERPPVDSLLYVLMSASAIGMTKQLNVDTDSIAPPSSVPPTNGMPRIPFDTVIQDVEVPQDKLIELSVSQATGGSLNVFWKTVLKEMVRT